MLTRAADAAQLNGDSWPPLRFHDLRHPFASHLIVDLGLDVYTHLFDDARHTREIRRRMAASQFAFMLDGNISETPVSVLPLTQRGDG